MRSDDRGAFRDCPGGQDQRIGWEIDQVEAVGKRSEEGDGVSRDHHRLEERSNGPAKWPRNKMVRNGGQNIGVGSPCNVSPRDTRPKRSPTSLGSIPLPCAGGWPPSATKEPMALPPDRSRGGHGS